MEVQKGEQSLPAIMLKDISMESDTEEQSRNIQC